MKDSGGFNWRMFYEKYSHILWAVITVLFILLLGLGLHSGAGDPMAGVHKDYEQDENKELTNLVKSYYKAYAAGDVDGVKKVANPVSDTEASYIGFYSQYVEKYEDIKVLSKRGADNDSYLVSVDLKIRFKDVDTAAPGLDFFYVQTDKDGKLFINNVYSSFNQAYKEYDTDADIQKIIDELEKQDDVVELQQKVEKDYSAAVDKDQNLNRFVSETLPAGLEKWAKDYKAQVKAAEDKAKAEQEAKRQAEEQAKKDAEEAANAVQKFIQTQTVVYQNPDGASAQLGSLPAATQVTMYTDENGWAKIDFNGTKAYVQDSALGDAAPQVDTSRNGQTVMLTDAVNIRSDRNEGANKVALAYGGESVMIVESYPDGWTKVVYNGQEGYVQTQYLPQ